MNSSSIWCKTRASVLLLLTGVATSGCYEWQAAAGQAALMWKREPVARVIADPSTPAKLRRQLDQAMAIREFASRDLDLPDNGSYRSYVDVGRRFVVWNVFAAPQFSVRPKRWCYPLVGCVAYRGYFAEANARNYAERLRDRGMDASVRGVAAYSTLGHFNDPILSTMLGWSDADLASIIFHELTHQLLYVPNDATFNESLANFVEDVGVRRWLRRHGRETDLAAYSLQRQRYRDVVDLLIATRTRLDALYRSHIDAATMLARKQAEFADLRESYLRLSANWGATAPFAHWFGRDLNNADLASVAMYERCVPGFERILEASGGDLPVFFAQVRSIAKLGRAARDARVCDRN